MARRVLTGLVFVVAVAAVGGIGFAAFTSQVTLSGSGRAGSVDLEWACIANPSLPCDSSAVGVPNTGVLDSAATGYATCTFEYVNFGFGLEVNASNLAPGDTCTMPTSFGGVLGNFGSLPAKLTVALTGSSASCGYFQFTDNLFFTTGVLLGGAVPSSSISIGANSYVPAGGYTATLELLPGAPATCQGVTDTATWTVTATAT